MKKEMWKQVTKRIISTFHIRGICVKICPAAQPRLNRTAAAARGSRKKEGGFFMKKSFAILLAALLALMTCGALADSAYLLPLAEPVTISMGISQSANVSDYEDNYFTKWLEEQTGVDLELVLFPSNDAGTKLNMMVASGETLPDIITFGLNNNNVYEWGSEGVLMPWNDWYAEKGGDFYAFCESIGIDGDRDVLGQIMSPDGNIYASPFYSYSYNNSVASARVWIDQAWLDKLDIKAPANSDELIEVLKAFRDQDPNGNGEADEIPMIGDNALNWLQNMFIYKMNANDYLYLPLNETDGALVPCYDKDEYREFLQYANRLVADGLLSPLSFTMDQDQLYALALADVSQVGIIANSNITPKLSEAADRYMPVEQPVGPHGAQYTTMSYGTAYPRSAVTVDCENPDVAMDFLMYGFTEDGIILHMIQRYGEPEVDWRRYDPAIDTGRVTAIPGFEPYVVELNIQWGVMTNKLWQVQVFGYVSNPAWWVGSLDPNAEKPVANYYLGIGFDMNRKYGPDVADVVTVNSFLYTDEEIDQWSDARTALRTYLFEARALFAIGEMDPFSDEAWNGYLNELEKLGYKELVAVDTAAYARKQEMLSK